MNSGNRVTQPASVLRAALAHTDMSRGQLQVEFFSVGGPLRPTRLDEILGAVSAPTRQEHDQIALALNNWYVEQGLGHAVPYYDELWMNDGERLSGVSDP